MADLEDRKVALIAQLDSHRKQLSASGHRIQGRFNAMRRSVRRSRVPRL